MNSTHDPAAQPDGDAAAAQPRPWTARETADDLIAQLEDALHGGWSGAQLSEALTHQGLEAETAANLVEEVAKLDAPDGGHNTAPDVIILLQTRRFLRDPDDPLTVLASRREALAAALQAAGLREATAAAVCSELAALERRGAQVYFKRMRRLGVQGMVVGGLATALLGYGGLYGGPEARWHLTTAAVTLALFIYSTVLFRRGRKP